VIKFNLIICI